MDTESQTLQDHAQELEPLEPLATLETSSAGDEEGETATSELHAEIERLKLALGAAEDARVIDRAAVEAGAVDAEAIGLLIRERRTARPMATVEELVQELRTAKPGLFRSAGAQRATASLARPPAGAGRGASATPMDQTRLAQQRAAEGDRSALLLYMKLKREGAD
jgi:hypothetical protein